MRRERREERKKEKKQKKKSKLQKFVKGVTLTFCTVSLIGVIGASAMVIKYKPIATDIWNDANHKVASINEGTFKNKTETVIYDNKGKVIKEVASHDYYYIEGKDIKADIKDAVIAVEDVRYLEHNGFDVKAIGRAVFELIKNKGEITQGGSTITQQLVKVQFLSLEKVYSRKIEEILIAMKLEEKYSKEDILEFYLNNINYGNGAYGIETASKTYFNKPSKDLTISEIALLTSIPNNPTVYNPVRNMDNTLKRRDMILSEMKENGFITDVEYQEAIAQKIVLNMPEKKYQPETYEVSYALSSATKILMENEGFQFKYWFDSKEERNKYWENYNDVFLQLNKKIRNGGYQIHTTIDMQKQAQLQETVNKNLSGFTAKDSESGLYKMQGAGAVIDNETGDLVAIVGGRTQNDVANTFNRAFLAYRQPGSAIKPLVAYTPAFEKGKLASSIMTDKKVKDGPSNWDNSYHGSMTLRKAVEQSWNTIPFQLLNQYGSKEMVSYLSELEFSNLVPEDANPIVAIGGFTYGATPLEMTAGYSTLARNGEYIKPTGIKKIVDFTNTTLYENKHKKKRVYDSGASYLMTDVLKGVMTRGTAKQYALNNQVSAGKTGTTNSNKDAWMAGYTPYYTTVIWTGYDTPQALSNTNLSKEIWKDFMNTIHKGLKKKDFKQPDRISYMFVNPNTGEVNKQDGKGWWRQELVPEIYWELQEKRKEEARLKAERDRKEAERQRLEAIKQALEDAGITQEEETQLEYEADSILASLEDARIYSEYDYEYVYGVMNEAKMAIERVALKEPRDKLYSRYNKEVNRIEAERYDVEHPVVIEPEPEPEPILPEVPVEEVVIPEQTNPTNTQKPSQSKPSTPTTKPSKPTTPPVTENGEDDTQTNPPTEEQPEGTGDGTEAEGTDTPTTPNNH
ncbi:penicillin-binding protein [Bacillus sp. M6-12]|uniref:transglycosylase domain-containing protein n=1 Tax=Bacillus sp. M6-12 TaxID=2054166 RepID=UPI000C769233|nr:transglycosylase domain-containing protein [Bacillus sp. M6-12]PLS18836.1 penicillin-binding protein [Bacillus sp. M6-12]